MKYSSRFFFALSLLLAAACSDKKNNTNGPPPVSGIVAAPAAVPAIDPLSSAVKTDAKTGALHDETGWETTIVGNDAFKAHLVTLSGPVVKYLQTTDKDFSADKNAVQIVRPIQMTNGAVHATGPGVIEFLDVPASEPVMTDIKRAKFELTYKVHKAKATPGLVEYDLYKKGEEKPQFEVGLLSLQKNAAKDGTVIFIPTIVRLCEAEKGLKPVCEVKLAAGKFDDLVLLPDAVKENESILAERNKTDLQKGVDQVNAAKSDLAKASALLDQAVAKEASNTKLIEKQKAEITAAQQNAAAAQKQADETKAALAKTDAKLKKTEGELKTASDNLAQAQKDVSTRETVIQTLQAKVDTLSKDDEAQKAELASLKKKLAEAIASLETAKKGVNKAENELKEDQKPKAPEPAKEGTTEAPKSNS